jgi:hypothetical protein
MIRVLGLGVIFVLAAGTTGAMAGETTIGDVLLNLPTPAGFCELSGSNPSDSRVSAIIGGALAQGGIKLLGISADCQQLADWHAGGRPFLDDYGQYQTQISQMDQLVVSPEAAIHQACVALRAQGSQIVSSTSPDVKSIIEGALKSVKMNGVTFAGVFAEDQTACYSGQIQNMQATNGTQKTQLVLVAITVVKNKYVYVDRFSVYTTSDAVADELAKLQSTVVSLQAANK